MANKHWTLNDRDYVARALDSEYIILHVASGRYYTLEGPGAVIFKALVEDRPQAEIETLLRREYADVAPKTLSRDLSDLIRDLRSKNILAPSG